MIVLWGARADDVLYNTPAFWNEHLPIGVPTITTSERSPWIRYGDLLDVIPSPARDSYYLVVGVKHPVIAVEEVGSAELLAKFDRRTRALRHYYASR